MERDALVVEIIELATACQTGSATDDERARLERLLEDSESARHLYLRMADDTVTLNDVRQARLGCSPGEASGACGVAAPVALPLWRQRRWMAVAAAAALAAVAAWGWTSRRGQDEGSGLSARPRGPGFARIVNLADVQWADGVPARREWERVGKGQTLRFESGRVEMLYDNGVQFVVQGPANCEFLSESQVVAYAGKLVARVGPEAVGFEIVTPHAKVVDRGTSFGMTIDPNHQTDVVVYEGLVDLSLPAGGDASGRRLTAGEAMRIGQDGHVGRIASVADGTFLPPPRVAEARANESDLIASVTDNLKPSQTAKYYRVIAGGFREDCPAYVDRHHQWNGVDEGGIPPFLSRGDYVMTFNDDKAQHDLRIAVQIAQPARLYLLIDDRIEPPKWLVDSFQNTGWDIGIDEGYDDVVDVKTAVGAGKSIEWTFSVWMCEVSAPTTVLLGSIQEEEITTAPRDVLRAMYGIVATPLSAVAPAVD